MSSRLLIPLLTLCGLLASGPAILWTAARYIDRIDVRFMESIGQTATTLPIGLALAALVLAVHGMKRNAQFQQEVAEEAEERLQLTALQLAPVGGNGGAAVAGTPRTASVSASRTGPAAAAPAAAAAAPTAPAKKKPGKSPADKAMKKGKQRGKSLAKREIRKSFRELRR